MLFDASGEEMQKPGKVRFSLILLAEYCNRWWCMKELKHGCLRIVSTLSCGEPITKTYDEEPLNELLQRGWLDVFIPDHLETLEATISFRIGEDLIQDS